MLDRKVNEGGRGCESVLVRDFWKSSGKIVGCWMLDVGCWMLDVGFWRVVFGYDTWLTGRRCWIRGEGDYAPVWLPRCGRVMK